ncbi:Scramblase-domain-containing protein [Cokeromyces recurvatus]|uniref:Scramblase-domain-containing protein n=1 Tax=Cokeromyces recurvatus TaxID=90255 RepID=UPI00221E4638|nr:Scramblase-domain-containing protein [Cokeromyces recurvatus]KAI7902800.1 Scramblase-domain-containing protein [Cokeromyces recurvatus]
MYKNRFILLLTKSQQQTSVRNKAFSKPLVQASYYYSSLRRVRQTGPRNRVLNHVEQLRPHNPTSSSRTALESISTAPKIAKKDALIHEKNPAAVEEVEGTTTTTLVEVPIDKDHQIVKPNTSAASLLTQSAVIVGRELEMMNVFLGYEQANRYRIMDPQGTPLGYIAEEEGFGKSISRQLLRTHRKMNATILNPEGQVIFKIIRPYSLINSQIFIYTDNDELIGEVQQRWHLLRRQYDLFVGKKQFATIDTPFLGWDFALRDEHGGTLGNVSRNFVGFAREIFTDTGEYVLRMDAVDGHSRGMTLDERAVTLACAISIDFDYFSRHSTHGGGGFLPFPMFGMGGGGEVDNSNEQQGIETEAPPPPPPPPQQQNTNEWGDPWLTDDEAGVSNPDDGGFMDVLKDFFDDQD